MAKVDLLSAAKVRTLKEPGDYLDGRGLYLQVRSETSKSWLLKYSLAKKAREMGLGALEVVSLGEARDKREFYRRLLKDGIDPIQHKKAEAAAKALAQSKNMTFKDACAAYIADKRGEWKSLKHAGQWDAALKRYAFPEIGKLFVRDIDDGLIIKVLRPIWSDKLETGTRVRSRIKTVLDWAKVSGFREGENPARWTGHLEHLLASPEAIRKVKPVEHHASLPYTDLPAFMKDLRLRDAIAAAAMEFLILTATRTNETLGARWAEIDLAKSIWTVPAARMKGNIKHEVPLSPAALKVLERMRKLTNGEFIFFGQSSGRALSNMALLTLLKRMKRTDITSHGFRSTFRDWAAERGYQDAVAEAALAHKVPDAVIAAYKRTTFFELRKKLMDDWAAFATSDPVKAGDNVVELRASGNQRVGT
jgi:integrase